ncbi:MAG: 6-phosphofructokinase [Myxococcales bacterium]|nr:6-phosphofructokinase [Myxococcales bacterium]USN50052.1 MAG: 6-phosphofructokinase [Myxococcales bacterium]
MLKTIAVLTGGGDCPGLNPAIKSVTQKALSMGLKVIGIRSGWQGLIDDLNPLHLDAKSVHHIDREGGTILQSSRTNPFKMKDGPNAVIKRMHDLNIDALVAIGGEDTLGVAHRLYCDFKVPVVGIPKTIDGDLSATDYCLGFESAVTVVTESIDRLRSTAQSHERSFVVEVMGRHAGHLALKSGISAGADMILIPEYPFDLDQVVKLIIARKNNTHPYSMIVIAEGARPAGSDISVTSKTTDSFGHIRLGGAGFHLSEYIENHAHIDCRPLILGHLQRGGSPSAFDRRMGHHFGIVACEALVAGKFGTMASLSEGRITLKSLSEAVKELHVVDTKKYYDTELYQAKSSLLS